MKKSRFSEQPIAFILKHSDDGTSVEEVCRKAGISQQTYYRWRKKNAGLMPSEVRRLKVLEEENARLKRMAADLSLDKDTLQGAIRRPRRTTVADGLPDGPIVRRVEDPHPSNRRCLLKIVAGDRYASALSRLRRGRDPGAGNGDLRCAKEHPLRQRTGVHLAR